MCLFADWALRPFPGSCIGLGSLTAQWQATSVANTAVTAKIQQALDVELVLTPEVTFNIHLRDFGAQLIELFLGEVLYLGRRADACRLAQLFGRGVPYPIDIGEGDRCMFVIGDVDPC